MRICDLHGLRFEAGKEKMIRELNACIITGDRYIQIIHGYHGHVFKTYIHSHKFLEDMTEEGIYIEKMDGSHNPGSTDITLSI